MGIPIPVLSMAGTAETIRDARAKCASDIKRSRARLTDLSAAFRAEAEQFARLVAIGELVNVTDVSTEKDAVLIDESVRDKEKGDA